jgi:hypothetical protein
MYSLIGISLNKVKFGDINRGDGSTPWMGPTRFNQKMATKAGSKKAAAKAPAKKAAPATKAKPKSK